MGNSLIWKHQVRCLSITLKCGPIFLTASPTYLRCTLYLNAFSLVCSFQIIVNSLSSFSSSSVREYLFRHCVGIVLLLLRQPDKPILFAFCFAGINLQYNVHLSPVAPVHSPLFWIAATQSPQGNADYLLLGNLQNPLRWAIKTYAPWASFSNKP